MPLPSDLKGYRAPRSPWGWIMGVALLVAVGGIVGPLDYAAQLDMAGQNFEMRAKLAARPRMAEIAPLRLRRCGETPSVAKQADGGKWKGACAPEADLTKRAGSSVEPPVK